MDTTGEPGYSFTSDWFSGNIPTWNEVLNPYRGRENVHYLEVGLYEGRSAIWMLDNILTHPSSKLTGIDAFYGDLRDRCRSNLEKSGCSDRVRIINGLSQIELRKLAANSFDIIYIDGGHSADAVLADVILSWELLNIGGILILDDYDWKRGEFPDELRPQFAVDVFLTAFQNRLELVHRGSQVIVRKRADWDFERYYSVVGQYEYDWCDRKLLRAHNGQHVSLTGDETLLIEQLLHARPAGELSLSLAGEAKKNPAVLNLIERLGLNR